MFILYGILVGINSFEVFHAYKGVLMLDDSDVLKVFSKAKELGSLAMAHCENGEIIEQVWFVITDLSNWYYNYCEIQFITLFLHV